MDASLEFAVRAVMKHTLEEEFDGGYMYSEVYWNDGARQSVPFAFEAGRGEVQTHSSTLMDHPVAPRTPADGLVVTSSAPANLLMIPPNRTSGPYSDLDTHWSAVVPFGAFYEVGELLAFRVEGVRHGVCFQHFLGRSPPGNPQAMHTSLSQTRLAAPTDESSFDPVNVSTEALIKTLIDFGDGTTRDMSTDPRINHTVDDASCAEIVKPNTLRVRPNATCTSIRVDSYIPAFKPYFVNASNVSVPVVYMEAFEVIIYPRGSGGQDPLPNNKLGQVECVDNAFQNADVRAYARLSDAAIFDVTSKATIASSDASKVDVDVLRVVSIAPGTVNITGTFGTFVSTVGLEVGRRFTRVRHESHHHTSSVRDATLGLLAQRGVSASHL